ncbi:MAG: transcriptional regulator [Gemmatimonadetes bacterium]|jgi:DNA-binding transcriptional regulator YiaG|nr:transcriptional regulator [Gemmatimonadota bacterium]|tara:strand:+ start:116 stop:316 length:201 start_codon:yes stop_codon:yes gene_type:complete
MKFTPDAVKQLRERLGLTQAEFAKRVGVSVRAVAHWEAGTRNVSTLAQRVLQQLTKEAANGETATR